MKMEYSAGLLGVARIDFIGGWQLFIRSRLCEIAGPMLIIIKDADMFYGFSRIEDIKVRCQMVINGVQFGWLNWITSRLLLPQFLRYKLVYPKMKAKFIVPPEKLNSIKQT